MLGKVIFENKPFIDFNPFTTQDKDDLYLNIYSVFQSLGHFKPVRDNKKISCHDTMRLHYQSIK